MHSMKINELKFIICRGFLCFFFFRHDNFTPLADALICRNPGRDISFPIFIEKKLKQENLNGNQNKKYLV